MARVGLTLNSGWHFKTPSYQPFQAIHENRIYVSAARVCSNSCEASSLSRTRKDDLQLIRTHPVLKLVEPATLLPSHPRRIPHWKLSVFVTDGHLPYPLWKGDQLATRFRALPLRWRKKRSRWALVYLSNRTLQMDELPPWSNSLEDTSRRYTKISKVVAPVELQQEQHKSVERWVSLENRDTNNRSIDWVMGILQHAKEVGPMIGQTIGFPNDKSSSLLRSCNVSLRTRTPTMSA